MVAYIDESEESLNQLFRALADGTRRDILARSMVETPSVSELAANYAMSFAAVQKHVAVLERAGLIQKRPQGREQLVSTDHARLKRAGRASRPLRSDLAAAPVATGRCTFTERKLIMPLTSITKDPSTLSLTVIGDYAVPQQRLWEAFADPRQLERFWGPPAFPATFTHHDFRVGGRAEYFLSLPEGQKWHGSWKFTKVDPVDSFEANDGEDNAEDENMPAGMTFRFGATSTGSRMTIVTRFSSIEAMEQTIPGMEQGLRAAMPQLDALLAEVVAA